MDKIPTQNSGLPPHLAIVLSLEHVAISVVCCVGMSVIALLIMHKSEVWIKDTLAQVTRYTRGKLAQVII